MRDRLTARAATAAALLLAVLVTAGSGVAHGAAHLHEADAHIHGGVDPAADAPSVTAPAHHERHGHVQVDDGLRARAEVLLLARAGAVDVPAARVLIGSTGAIVPRAALARADPGTGPPPRLRAPPAA
jgi:hypothetical protein